MIRFLADNNMWLTSLGALASVSSALIALAQLLKSPSPPDTAKPLSRSFKARNISKTILFISLLAFTVFITLFIFKTVQYGQTVAHEKLLLMAREYDQEGNVEALSALVGNHPDDPELYQQLVSTRTEYRESYLRKVRKLSTQKDFVAALALCKLFPSDEDFSNLFKEITQLQQSEKGVWQEGDYLWGWDDKTKNAKRIAYYPRLRYWLVNPSRSRIAVYEAQHARVYVILMDGSNECLIADYPFITDNTRIAGWANDDTLRLTDGRQFKLNQYNAVVVQSKW